MLEIIELEEGKEIKNDGKLPDFYKQVRKTLNLNTNKKFPPSVNQILSGLNSISNGLVTL